jgi:hypothetical protein
VIAARGRSRRSRVALPEDEGARRASPLTARTPSLHDALVRRPARVLGCLLLAALAAGCGGGSADGGEPATTGGATHPVSAGALVPDFSLLDVNPASPTAGHPVSPRDYLKRVSAWYFGHAT